MRNKKKWDIRILSSFHIKKVKKRGVAILISNSIWFEFISEIKDNEGRFILLRGRIDRKEVMLLNVYASPGSDMSFYGKIFNLFASESHGILVAYGDYNFFLRSSDTTNGQKKRNPIGKRINRMLTDLGLMDVWHAMHGSTPGYTFYSARQAVYSRLDYFFMFKRDLHRLKECRVGQRDLSDHTGVYLTLHLDGSRRKTLWRLNTGMLNDLLLEMLCNQI